MEPPRIPQNPPLGREQWVKQVGEGESVQADRECRVKQIKLVRGRVNVNNDRGRGG